MEPPSRPPIGEVPSHARCSRARPGVLMLTKYPVIDAPLPLGAENVMPTLVVPARARTRVVGLPGSPAGTTKFDGSDVAPVPNLFVAATRNRYETPFVRPVTVQPLPPVVHVCPPGAAVTRYPVIGLPLPAAGVYVTEA